jgi:hypothetical protein
MLVNNINLLQSFNYRHYLFYKKRFKTEINCLIYGPSSPAFAEGLEVRESGMNRDP